MEERTKCANISEFHVFPHAVLEVFQWACSSLRSFTFGLTAHTNLLTLNRFLGSFQSCLELWATTNAMMETTVHEQLLPDTAVDPTWCWYIRQLNSDIAKLHQNQKSHNRNLRDKKDDLQLVAVITYPGRGVGKEQKRKFLNTTATTQIKLPAHYISTNLYSNNLLNFTISTRCSRKCMACWNNMFIKGTP